MREPGKTLEGISFLENTHSKGKIPYPIRVGHGILQDTPDLLHQALGQKTHRDNQVLIVTDRNVAKYHLVPLAAALRKGGFKVTRIVFPAGERLKRSTAWYRLLRAMVKHGLTRDSTVIALGGGVIGDFAGFASSTYMRGCHLVQVPTSLLAQVDSAIGGKVGINLPEGKNLVGSFHNPIFVLIDTDTLRTLPPREFGSGLAEIVKYGLIWDHTLFQRLEGFFDTLYGEPSSVLTNTEIKSALIQEQAFLRDIIQTSARIKAEIVRHDEREQGLRMILNFGHTFGHALEQVTGYRHFLHGEAVLLGMQMADHLSASLGLIGDEEKIRILQLLSRFPVPRKGGLKAKRIIYSMGKDKKRRGGSLYYIVLEKIGRAVTKTDVPDSMVMDSIRRVLETNRNLS